MPCKALILTVGVSPEPVLFSIAQLKPEFIALVATDTPECRRTVEAVLRAPGIDPVRVKAFDALRDDPSQIGKVISLFFEAYRWLTGQGLNRDEIAAEPTAGRKWMSAGATMAASSMGLDMIYVDVKQGNDRKINSETMRIVDLANAYNQTGILVAQAATEYFNRNQFHTARTEFSRIKASSAQWKLLFAALAEISHAFADWDQFGFVKRDNTDHREVILKRLSQGLENLEVLCAEYTRATPLDDFRIRGLEMLEACKQVGAPGPNSFGLLCELLCNAGRKIEGGHFDMAMAVLYRCTEAVEQYLLFSRHNIITTGTDWSMVPGPVREKFERDIGTSKDLDLTKGYKLLFLLKEDITKDFFRREERAGKITYKEAGSFNTIQTLLSQRNKSIMAHGFQGIGAESCEKLLATLEILLASIDKTRHDFFKRLKIPKMEWKWEEIL